MLIIIIVTDLAWETFLDTCTHDCTAIVYLIQRHCPSYLRMYALGKGLVEHLQPQGILFIYYQQLVEKYIRLCLNS